MSKQVMISAEVTLKLLDSLKQGIMIIYHAHMMGHPYFTQGMVERAKLVVEQFLESKGIELEYKKEKPRR